MSKRVKVADIVAFVFETRAATFAEPLQNRFDVRERVAKDSVARAVEVRNLPIVLPFDLKSSVSLHCIMYAIID